jgi:hypothetical protein
MPALGHAKIMALVVILASFLLAHIIILLPSASTGRIEIGGWM